MKTDRGKRSNMGLKRNCVRKKRALEKRDVPAERRQREGREERMSIGNEYN